MVVIMPPQSVGFGMGAGLSAIAQTSHDDMTNWAKDYGQDRSFSNKLTPEEAERRLREREAEEADQYSNNQESTYREWDFRGSKTIKEEIQYVRDTLNKKTDDNAQWGKSKPVDLTFVKESVNGGNHILKLGDRVVLDNFQQTEGTIRRILRAGDNADNDTLVLELANGNFSASDALSANLIRTNKGESIEYQGDQWYITGQLVKWGKTWISLTDDSGQRNMMLRQTRDNILGHTPGRDPNVGQIYKPDTQFEINGRIWFLNDVYVEAGQGIADLVQVGNLMSHKQYPAKEVGQFAVGHRDVRKPAPAPIRVRVDRVDTKWNSIPTQNVSRRRLPDIDEGVDLSDEMEPIEILKRIKHPMNFDAADFDPFNVPGFDTMELWRDYVRVLGLSENYGLLAKPHSQEFFNLLPGYDRMPSFKEPTANNALGGFFEARGKEAAREMYKNIK